MSVSDINQQIQQDIEILQMKVAYQEDTIEQLNLIVTAQQTQIQQLEKFTASIVEKLKTLQTQESPINDATELPPHY
jgi:SlyX protein